MSEKRCFKCGEVKPLTEFYRHPQMADGRLNKCRSCTSADVRANRRSKVQQYRDYDKRRFARPSRKRQAAEGQRRHRAKHPEKSLARQKVQRAVASGSLVRMPCEVCGCKKVEAHHVDYSQPLLVRWLCRTHHMAEHGAAVALE